MWALLSLLFSSTLVAAAPRHHDLLHRQWHHAASSTLTIVTRSTSTLSAWPVATPNTETPDTSTPSDADARLGPLDRMTAGYVGSICKTCHDGIIQWPLPSSSDGVPMPMPVVEGEAPQPSFFPRPESTPYKLSIMNYCPYDLYFLHLDGVNTDAKGAATILGQGVISGNGGSCSEDAIGSVMKVGKDSIIGQPVQIEYGGNFYDMSLIDCLRRDAATGMRTADTSACAGHEYGLQLSNPGSRAWQCDSGAWCDDQAYFYEENLCKKTHPNTSTKSGDYSEGLTMEFCASLSKLHHVDPQDGLTSS